MSHYAHLQHIKWQLRCYAAHQRFLRSLLEVAIAAYGQEFVTRWPQASLASRPSLIRPRIPDLRSPSPP